MKSLITFTAILGLVAGYWILIASLAAPAAIPEVLDQLPGTPEIMIGGME
jgi:hypothetical protein